MTTGHKVLVEDQLEASKLIVRLQRAHQLASSLQLQALEAQKQKLLVQQEIENFRQTITAKYGVDFTTHMVDWEGDGTISKRPDPEQLELPLEQK